MTLNMNTIPKFNIKVIDLKNEIDIKNYFLYSKYLKKEKIYWRNFQLEIIGIGFLISSEFSNEKEYHNLINDYKAILKKNQPIFDELKIPFIFIGSSFNLNQNKEDDIWSEFPKGKIFIPKVLIISNNKYQKAILLSSDEAPNNDFDVLEKSDFIFNSKSFITPNNSDNDKNQYKDIVDKAIKLITNKTLSKIVLSRQKSYSIKSKDDVLFNLISQNNIEDNTTNFIFDLQERGTFFGSSPETLFSLSDNKLKTEAIAGSFKDTENVDLNKRKKEVQEHNFVVNYLKKQLTDFSSEIKIYNNDIMRLNKISHIRTKIESTIDKKYDAFNILYQIHPTPAVAGNPKNLSMQKIEELEPHNRGWYSGAMGWIDNKQDAHFIVTIRSGIIKKNLLNIYAGCGITKDSDANAEYNESEMKFDYILSKLNNE